MGSTVIAATSSIVLAHKKITSMPESEVFLFPNTICLLKIYGQLYTRLSSLAYV